MDSARASTLITATARADSDAFADLYNLCAPKLFGVILRICGDRQIAEDVLQETFVVIWRRAATYDARRGGALAWLTTIARNRAIDAIRGRKRADRPTEEDEIERLADMTQIHGVRADYAELDALAHCLERLDERQREAVLRAYYEGRSREELAQHFTKSVNTIKTWLRRGLSKLRLCLEE